MSPETPSGEEPTIIIMDRIPTKDGSRETTPGEDSQAWGFTPIEGKGLAQFPMQAPELRGVPVLNARPTEGRRIDLSSLSVEEQQVIYANLIRAAQRSRPRA
jgi:hypothetical protein